MTHFGAHVGDPRISPDGRKLAFETGKDGNSEIYVMNIDGTNPVRLTNHPADDRSPAISHDGQQVVFSSDRDGEREQFELFIMDIDGSNLRKIETPGEANLYPSFAPDRSKSSSLTVSTIMIGRRPRPLSKRHWNRRDALESM